MADIFAASPTPEAVVTAQQARFTVLTSRLIRMEYSPLEQFEDRPSQAFWWRRLPVPEFSLRSSAGQIEIETQHLLLRYQVSPKGFTPQSLSILVKATGETWHYGDTPRRGRNLGGTARTLDEAAGRVRLEPGLMARSGWAVVDDSQTLVFNAEGWLTPRLPQAGAPANKVLDLYFFGYGHDYPACLRDFNRVAGATPLLPRWALGNWWSRYWAYSAEELLQLVEEFRAHQVPLAVCIVDMDWHITETGDTGSGWTGYTWNRTLFPDPTAFIANLHALGLKTALNLHPAEGIHPHEAAYEQFARFMGRDAQAGAPIPFDCADPHFMRGYFELLHHPLEAQGVDFWWIDWQQGMASDLPGLDPLWWLNHLHFYDLGRDGETRPFIFSRWGGLGNHRYPIGFSGDTVVGWEALDFQPYFTAAAANVGYGWWSHDIGGHMGGIEDDELYARWVQYGVFSPILRLHSTNNPYHERRPWGRGPAAAGAATAAMRLRHALLPYLYSMAWRNHTTAIPLVTPLYYTHPEADEAYRCPQEYWFGSELLAAPFTQPAGSDTHLSRQIVWLPPGEWFDFFTGEYMLPGWQTIYGDLMDTPVYARAGGIVPMAPDTTWGSVASLQTLHLQVFPGANGRFDLYEDDSETTAYEQGEYALTTFTQVWNGKSMNLAISPATGDLSIIPAQRDYRLRVRCVRRPDRVAAQVNGTAKKVSWIYDDTTATLELGPVRLQSSQTLSIDVAVTKGELLARYKRTIPKLRKYLGAFHLDTWLKAEIEQEWPHIAAGEIDLHSYRQLSDGQRVALKSLLE